MAETVTEKEVCSKCGAEVREGTLFCYSCGERVASETEPPAQANGDSKTIDIEAQAALDDLAQKLSGDQGSEKPAAKLARAAEERKKARVAPRKTREFVWEPRNDAPLTFIITAAVIGIAAVLVVLITVIWK